MKPRRIVPMVMAAGGLAALACGLGAQETPPPPVAPGGGIPPTRAAGPPTQVPPSSPGFDTEAVNLCELLPLEELASLAGATPYPETVTETGPSCSYALDPGDGTADAYFFYLFPPETIAPAMDYVADYEQAEWLDGLGDRAYLQPDDSGMYDLVVLVEGRFALDLSGGDPGVLQTAARLLLERLGR